MGVDRAHPNKLQLKTLSSGIEFLGWVNFPKYRILKTKTKKRMIKRLMLNPSSGTIASYVHGNGKIAVLVYEARILFREKIQKGDFENFGKVFRPKKI